MNLRSIFSFNKKEDTTASKNVISEERCYNYGANGGFLFGNTYNKYNALNLSAVYRCTEIISDGVAMLPIHLKNYLNGEEYTNHPLSYVFNDRNNAIIGKYNTIKLLIQSMILRGNGFAYIDRDNSGKVNDVRFLPSDSVTINYNPQKNELYYLCSLIKGKIEPVNMIHVKKNTNDGINGVSLLSYASRTLMVANAGENAAKNFYEKGCNLSGILTVQGAMRKDQIEEARQNWNQIYTDGGSGLAILQGSMSYQPIQLNAADSQLLESRDFNVKDIARFFGVPIGLLDSSFQKFSTNEGVNLDFLTHTLQPYISVIEDEFNKKLLLPSERNYLTIDFEEEYMIKIDKTAMATYYSTMVNNGILSINEVRHNIGLNPIDGGDKHFIPFTKVEDNIINKDTKDNTENNE